MLYEKLRPGPGRSGAEVSAHQRTRLCEAMIEIVAESGYDAVTVRRLTRLAGVSTRSFYQHFDDKQECFLATHERLVLTSVRNIVRAQKKVGLDWRERLRLGLSGLMRQIVAEPQRARLVLVEAYARAPTVEHLASARAIFESAVRSCSGRAPGEVALPPFVVSAIVAGVTRVARDRVLSGRERELPQLVDDLGAWALSYSGEACGSDRELDRWGPGRFAPDIESGVGSEGRLLVPGDERTLVLGAVAKLVASGGYRSLSVPRIRTAAGVSRRSFDANFDGVESCFCEAVKLHSTQAVAAACPRNVEAGDWPSALRRAVATFCAQVGRDPVLSTLAFSEILAPGIAGMRCRERLITTLAEQLRRSAPAGEGPSKVAAEASAAAAWDAVHGYVATDRAKALRRRHVALVTFLLLAPATTRTAADVSVSSSSSIRS
jgi:AcrR family transcriptional regulator